VQGVTGPLPVDPAGTVGGAAGCTSTPSSSPAPSSGDGSGDASAPTASTQDVANLTAVSAGLPEAATAQPVTGHVAFTG
jgi:hypothetical protein